MTDDKFTRMEALFNEAVKTDVATHAIDFLCRAHLMLRIVGDDLTAAKGAIHSAGGYAAATP
jgi:hypothetical protein